MNGCSGVSWAPFPAGGPSAPPPSSSSPPPPPQAVARLLMKPTPAILTINFSFFRMIYLLLSLIAIFKDELGIKQTNTFWLQLCIDV